MARFRVLIAAMLSSQTKDPVNAAAMERLTAHGKSLQLCGSSSIAAGCSQLIWMAGLTVEDMIQIDEKKLGQLIHPVSFFNTKAKNIKKVASILKEQAQRDNESTIDIPSTFDGLMALPGVGPKMAYLVMSCAWNKCVLNGVCLLLLKCGWCSLLLCISFGSTVGICVDTHVHRISNRLGWVATWNKKNPKAQDPEKTRKVRPLTG